MDIPLERDRHDPRDRHGRPLSVPDLPATLLVDVTDDDVRAARDAWRAARDRGAPEARVAELHRGYERLVRTQGRQLGEALRARRAAAGGAA